MAQVTKGKIIESSAVVLMARIVGTSGDPITQADVTSLLLQSVEKKTGNLITPSGASLPYTGTTLTAAATVFDELQVNDIRWDVDADGYNFLTILDGSYFPDGTVYQVKITVTPATGPAYKIVWELSAYDLAGE